MKKPIGVFNKDYFEVFIQDKYRQHWWLKKALGTLYCLAMREKVLLDEPISVSVCCIYTDRLSMEYNNAAMSTGMGGGNATVGMEGFLWKICGYRYENEEEKKFVEMHWKGYLADSKQQDARTSYVNLDKFIVNMKAKGYLKGHNCSVNIQSDGCGKQYKSFTHLKTCITLANSRSTPINWMVTCAHHGKSLVNALAGRDKYDLRCCLIDGTLNNAAVDCYGIGLSKACKCCDRLNSITQITGL
jgi:hypothetical protein